MPWNLTILVLIVGALPLGAPAFGQEKNRVTLTEKQGQFATVEEARIIRVRVGDTLVVSIPALPANGSVWHIVTSDGLKETQGTKYETKEGMPGAKGKQVFQFVVEHLGQHDLVLRLDRGNEIRGFCVFKLEARK